MSGMLIVNRDITKIFLANHTSQKVTYTNSTGSTVNILAGRLMGRITIGQKVLPYVSTATDGSQQPVGVAMDDYTVANGVTITMTICDGGEVAEEKIILAGAETLSTVITDDVSIRSAIERNTHIKLRPSTDMSGPYDNQ
ncbi:MAG: head decoration protein [Taibaiella sp.]